MWATYDRTRTIHCSLNQFHMQTEPAEVWRPELVEATINLPSLSYHRYCGIVAGLETPLIATPVAYKSHLQGPHRVSLTG